MLSRRSLLAFISAAASSVAAPFVARASMEDDLAQLAKEQNALFAKLPPIEKFEQIIAALTATAAEFDDSEAWNIGYAISPDTLAGISGDVSLIPHPTRPHLMLIDGRTGNIIVVGLPEGYSSWERVIETVKASARG